MIYKIDLFNKDHNMSNLNLLSINPFSEKFFDIAFQNLFHVLPTADLNNIEIEFKYAELRTFMTFYNERDFKDLPPAAKKRVEDLQLAQTNAYISSLKSLSKQSVIYLNPLGKGTYSLTAGFNQRDLKKFYHIKNLLKKISVFNHHSNFKPKEIVLRPANIYNELSLNNHNYLLRVIEENELRLDLFIKNEPSVPMRLQGRYSYSQNGGWVKTVKQPLVQQMDYLMSEQFFRMAINSEVQTPVSGEDLQTISSKMGGTSRAFDIRLKCAMRVQKGDLYQISLSEIFNINDLNICKDIAELMVSENQSLLNNYIKKMFVNFYSCIEKDNNSQSYEIQLELSKTMNAELKKLVMQSRINEVRGILQNYMGELYAIFYSDHTTKMKEKDWMNVLVPDSVPEGRLDNEFGSYLRERLYRLMSEGHFKGTK